MVHPKALLLDMGGVLLRARAERRPSEVVDRVGEIICAELDQTKARKLAIAELGLTPAGFSAALEAIAEQYEPDPRVWAILAERRATLKTAILNNGSSLALGAFDRRFGVFGAVDLFMNSALEGVGKPDPVFFARACTRLGVEPVECVFVDDTDVHTAAAARLGMQTLHWSDPERDAEQLLRLLGPRSDQTSPSSRRSVSSSTRLRWSPGES